MLPFAAGDAAALAGCVTAMPESGTSVSPMYGR